MMFTNHLKTFSLFALVSATSLLSAQENPPSDITKAETIQSHDCCCSNSFFFWGGLTLWQPIQENMQFGVISKNRVAAGDVVDGRELDLNTHFHPGFKVGMGYHLNEDRWDTLVEYTFFKSTEHRHKRASKDARESFILPAWQFPSFLNPQYASASEKWKLMMQFLDWDLTRKCCLGRRLSFAPFIGVRGALIRQDLRVHYINSDASASFVWPSTSIKQSSRSWGIGPRAGIMTDWLFCKGFRISAKQEIDILYSGYQLNTRQSSEESAANVYQIKQGHVRTLRTHLDMSLGLGWKTELANNACAFDVSADYNFNIFFNQNPFRNTINVDSVGKSIWPNGNLYLQGLTARLGVSF